MAGPPDHRAYDIGAVRRQGWAGPVRQGRYRGGGITVAVQEVRAELASLPGFADRLAAQGRRAAVARDPRWFAVYDLVREPARLLLISEWSDGRTLAEVQGEAPLSPTGALAVLDRVLAALEALDGMGMVHGHVDEGTVVLEPDGGVRLAEIAVCAAANPAADAAADVRDAARMGLRGLRRSGRRFRRLRQLLEAASEGRGAASAADLRRRLAAAASSLGDGWNDLANLPGAASGIVGPAPVTTPRRRRRFAWVGLAVLLILALVGAGIILLTRGGGPLNSAAGPLTVGADEVLTVTPASAGCDTTFVFNATGSLTGAGTLSYRWEQSDGSRTDVVQQRISGDQASFQFVQAWRLQGSQTVAGTMTLHILAPVDRSTSRTFSYRCP